MATSNQNGEEIRPLVPLTDENILNAIRNEATPAYQRRLPAATKANISDSIKTLQDIPELRNEFYHGLVNQFCGIYVNHLKFENPLSQFKRPAQKYGKIQQEIAVGLTKAHNFDIQQEYLGDDVWSTYKPQVKSVFHNVNRENWYPITQNESQLNYADAGDGGYITGLMAELMQSPYTSDKVDEFTSMTNLFAEYGKIGGYWKVHVDDVAPIDSTQDQARTLLRQLRTFVNLLPLFPYTQYNAAHMPVSVTKDEMIIFMSPQVHAAIDVNALAVLFNETYAQADARIFDIPAEMFGMNKVQAILTTKSFFYVWDYLYTTAAAPQNMITLGTNYALHHKESISLSPFADAILFWTGDGSDEIIKAIGNITIDEPTIQVLLQKYGNSAIQPTSAARGSRIQVVANATSANYPNLQNLGVSYEFVENNGKPGPSKPTSQFTTLSNTGVLLTGLDETASFVSVRAEVTYVDPTAPEAPRVKSSVITIPVSGDGLIGLQAGFVTKIAVSAADASIAVGKSTQMQAIATLTDGRTADVSNFVTWNLSDKSIATIGVDGTLKGVKDGTESVIAELFAVKSDAKNVKVTA